MTALKKIAFIGNYLPRRCGIATFTHDIQRAVAAALPEVETSVVAMTDVGCSYNYPGVVTAEIHEDSLGEYIAAAERLNQAGVDIVSLQHEYGIFGGDAGGHVIELLSRLAMPIVTTLHTVLANPTPRQRAVMDLIINNSIKIIVMADKARELLLSVHGIPAHKVIVIPHGIPNFPYQETSVAKPKFDMQDRSTILTFGLLSPNKGIEVMLDAMSRIIKSTPAAAYIVLGATHPNLVRREGEAYRNLLAARARELGIEGHVTFLNQFVDQPTLLEFISMADVYVTPYLNEAQMTSGTLAYSFGLGKAVVSTPYWHAKELLADGLGILVPFGDADALSREVSGLLTNDVKRHSMRKRAYEASRSMIWGEVAKRYCSAFEAARSQSKAPEFPPLLSRRRERTIPPLRLRHFLSLCDDTGILQHAVYSVANREHGYCVDDNARALLLSTALSISGDAQLSYLVAARFAAFIQDAWNPENGRFRNFMSYGRRWLESRGSEDSHGRTLWALGDCVARDRDSSRRRWAEALFRAALPAVESFASPRAWAFALLGLDCYCTVMSAEPLALQMRHLLAKRLASQFAGAETHEWTWFEDYLAYDNARLSQAMIQTGMGIRNHSYVDTGLKSLSWLMAMQTSSEGLFRPVGTESFGCRRLPPATFDQQPVEAAATISACAAAWRASGDSQWRASAKRAFGWFLGDNDLHVTLIDAESGGCADGLHPDRRNENRGAESALSYLLGLVEIIQLEDAVVHERAKPSFSLPRDIAGRSSTSHKISGGAHLVSISAASSTKLIPTP
ncbi:glycosyltransferase family 4 protein [Terrarubrum flagellatum]|uniref:glycosyltransferase family 4 protein n=1 Tax=Terrirubrum flagellatum TaxID=2895980 RepID=UPI0031455A97